MTDWNLHLDRYRCRHFTREYADQFDKNSKGVVGENFLYEALKRAAKGFQTSPPELLGEPTPVELR